MKVEERKENRELFAPSESMADRGSLRGEREKGYIMQIEEEIKDISDIEKLKKIYEYVTDLLLST